jgi:formylglycine-generating enzyme required for sulfatase activity
MAGNVFQWTSSWKESQGPRTKVVCGGSWASPLAPKGLKSARNLFPSRRDYQTGFRCAIVRDA